MKKVLLFQFLFLLNFINFALANSDNIKNDERDFKTNIEAGLNVSKGNARQKSVFLKNDITYLRDEWKNIFKTRIENTEVNERRIRERYDLNNQTRYNFDEKNFRLVEIEYIDDRFAGFDYRASQTFGYGRNFIKEKNKNFSAQISAGLRQTKLINDNTDLSPLIRASAHYDQEIKKGVIFTENLDISIDKEVVITRSDTSLKISLTNITDYANESLYLQIGYFFENRSVSEANRKKTDSIFMTTIGYSF